MCVCVEEGWGERIASKTVRITCHNNLDRFASDSRLALTRLFRTVFLFCFSFVARNILGVIRASFGIEGGTLDDNGPVVSVVKCAMKVRF